MDYTVKMQDDAGRVCNLHITADNLEFLVASGLSLEEAQEGAETNAFWNAVKEGQIGENAWVVCRIL